MKNMITLDIENLREVLPCDFSEGGDTCRYQTDGDATRQRELEMENINPQEAPCHRYQL
jgi:hypothetical protein